MPLLTVPGEISDAGIGNFGTTAILGYCVVFMGLILLMVVVTLIGKVFARKKADNTEIPFSMRPPESPDSIAPGTAGEIKLYNVDPRTAAMLMAIVADKLQKPLSELRFISIKEVE